MTVKLTLNKSIVPIVEAAAIVGVRAGVDAVARISDRKVPRDTGELARSQSSESRGLSGHVSYSDSKAVAAHENLTDRHPGGGEAKYLENALSEGKSAFLVAVAQSVRSVLN